MSKKGKHGVRNPKRTKPNPYAKRKSRGGWGRSDPRDDFGAEERRENMRDWYCSSDDYDDTPFEDSPEFDDSDIPWHGDDGDNNDGV